MFIFHTFFFLCEILRIIHTSAVCNFSQPKEDIVYDAYHTEATGVDEFGNRARTIFNHRCNMIVIYFFYDLDFKEKKTNNTQTPCKMKWLIPSEWSIIALYI